MCPVDHPQGFFIETMNDEFYMKRAIEMAYKGEGHTNPNPMVGCVVVKDGKIIAEDYHHECGKFHAERNALTGLEGAEGACLYVTLEPCCHYGKTPPCTDIIIEKKIAKVVIGSRDPNPKVSGKGAAILRAAGIEVIEDFMRKECDEINPIFFHYITTNLPYVTCKYAMTLDGKIATYTGDSRWITGETARTHVHKLRNKYSAIMAGIGTVECDDPMLNCRIDGGKDPLRVICDSNLKISLSSQIVRTAREIPTVVFAANVDPEKKALLEDAKVKVVCAKGDDGHVDLSGVIRWLGENKIDSLLIEGGGVIHEAAFKAGIVNHLCAYIAPKVFGGKDAKSPVEGTGIAHPGQAATFENLKITELGEDILLEYDIKGGMDGVYRNC